MGRTKEVRHGAKRYDHKGRKEHKETGEPAVACTDGFGS